MYNNHWILALVPLTYFARHTTLRTNVLFLLSPLPSLTLPRHHHTIKDIHASRLPQPFPPLFPPPDHQQHPAKSNHSPDQRKHQKRPLIPNRIPQLHHVERKREPKLLPKEIDQLCYFGRFAPIAVDRIRVNNGGEDLQPKTCQPHAEQGSEPVRVVGQCKPIYQQARRHQDRAGPDRAEPDLRRRSGGAVAGGVEGVQKQEARLLATDDVVDDPAREALAEDASRGEGAAVGEADDEGVPVEELLEDGGDGDGGEDGGEAVHCGVVEGGKDDGWIPGHLQRWNDELICTELELWIVAVEAEAMEVGALGEGWLCWWL